MRGRVSSARYMRFVRNHYRLSGLVPADPRGVEIEGQQCEEDVLSFGSGLVSAVSRKHDTDWSARLFSALFVLQSGWRVVTIPTQSGPSRRSYSWCKYWCDRTVF